MHVENDTEKARILLKEALPDLEMDSELSVMLSREVAEHPETVEV